MIVKADLEKVPRIRRKQNKQIHRHFCRLVFSRKVKRLLAHVRVHKDQGSRRLFFLTLPRLIQKEAWLYAWNYLKKNSDSIKLHRFSLVFLRFKKIANPDE